MIIMDGEKNGMPGGKEKKTEILEIRTGALDRYAKLLHFTLPTREAKKERKRKRERERDVYV